MHPEAVLPHSVSMAHLLCREGRVALIHTHTHLSFLFRVDEALLCKAREGWRVLETFDFLRDPTEGVGATGWVEDCKSPGQAGRIDSRE